ncbi:MAG: hypothetical protein ACREPA_02980 [Candidatus Dormibacteraceae bacterium]
MADPTLVPVIGAAARGGELWIIWEQDAGITLGQTAGAGLPSTVAAVQTGLGILAGLAALHQAGIAHGRLSPETVRLMPEGGVRLAGYGLEGLVTARAATEQDLAIDVRAAGEMICGLLDIPVGMAPASPLTPLEAARPALAAAARRVAAPGSGTGRLTARAAHGFLEESAGMLVEDDSRVTAQAEMSRMVVAALTGTSMSPPPASVPGSPASAVPRPPEVPSVRAAAAGAATAAGLRELASAAIGAASEEATRLRGQLEATSLPRLGTRPPRAPARIPGGGRRDRGVGRWWLVGALAALALVPMIVVAMNLSRSAPPGPSAALPGGAATPTPHPSAKAKPTPTAQPSPSPSAGTFGPPAAAPITSVGLTTPGGCQPGASCDLHVRVDMHGFSSAGPVTWSFKLIGCDGTVTSGPTDTVNADAGWTYVYGDTHYAVPNGARVVAVTSAPAQAASPELTVGACS